VGVSGRAEDETKMHMGGDEEGGLEAGKWQRNCESRVSLRAIVACGGSKNGIVESWRGVRVGYSATEAKGVTGARHTRLVPGVRSQRARD
jgi:hypothetical protein